MAKILHRFRTALPSLPTNTTAGDANERVRQLDVFVQPSTDPIRRWVARRDIPAATTGEAFPAFPSNSENFNDDWFLYSEDGADGTNGMGAVTSVTGGTGLTATPTTGDVVVNLDDTPTDLTGTTYTNATITVDRQGRLLTAASGSSNTGPVPNVFNTFQVPDGTSISPDVAQDTLMLAAGNDISITGSDDTITFNHTGETAGNAAGLANLSLATNPVLNANSVGLTQITYIPSNSSRNVVLTGTTEPLDHNYFVIEYPGGTLPTLIAGRRYRVTLSTLSINFDFSVEAGADNLFAAQLIDGGTTTNIIAVRVDASSIVGIDTGYLPLTSTSLPGADTTATFGLLSTTGAAQLSADELTSLNILEQNVVNQTNIESSDANPIAPRFVWITGSLADYNIENVQTVTFPTGTSSILLAIFHDGDSGEGTPPTVTATQPINIEFDRDAHDGISTEIDLTITGNQIITGHRWLGTYTPDTDVVSNAGGANTWIIPFADANGLPSNYTLNSGSGATLLDSIEIGTSATETIFGFDTTNSRDVISMHSESYNRVFPHFDDSDTPLMATTGLENLIARDDPDIPNDTGMQADIGYESANNQIDIVFAANTPNIDIGTVLVQQQVGDTDDLSLYWTVTRRAGNRYYGQASDAYASAIEAEMFGFENYATDGNNRFFRISSLDGPNRFQPTDMSNPNGKFTGYHRQRDGGILGTRLPDGKIELTFTQNPILTTASPNIPFVQPSDIPETILFSSNINIRSNGIDNIGGNRIQINAATRSGFVEIPRAIPAEFGTTSASQMVGNPTVAQVTGLLEVGDRIEFPRQIDQGSNIIRRTWHSCVITGITSGTTFEPSTFVDNTEGSGDIRISFDQIPQELITDITHSNQWHNTVVATNHNIWTLNQEGRNGVRSAAGAATDIDGNPLPARDADYEFIADNLERDSFTNFTRFRVLTNTPLLEGRLNVRYNPTTGHIDGTIATASTTPGATTFAGLSDTPTGYASGTGGQFVAVNSAETALEFVPAPMGGGVTVVTQQSEVPTGLTMADAGREIFTQGRYTLATITDAITAPVMMLTDNNGAQAAVVTEILNNNFVMTFAAQGQVTGTANDRLTVANNPNFSALANGIFAENFLYTMYINADGSGLRYNFTGAEVTNDATNNTQLTIRADDGGASTDTQRGWRNADGTPGTAPAPGTPLFAGFDTTSGEIIVPIAANTVVMSNPHTKYIWDGTHWRQLTVVPSSIAR